MHVCGRDRNLLGTLAHLLGAHDLGLRNLVIITGDPPKMGDFPDASAVYDLDSIGILKLAARLNHGVDPGGKALGATTRFVLATGAEPASLNYAREISRLHEKKAAGAELVMTQPVYDARVLERFLDDVAPLGLPVLVGLLPLASYRNAEFLHNEVPGMQVPDTVRERMRKAGGSQGGRGHRARDAGRRARSRGGRVRHAAARAVRARARGRRRFPGFAMKRVTALALVALVPVVACHRGPDAAAGATDALPGAALAEAGPPALPAIVPSRCQVAAQRSPARRSSRSATPSSSGRGTPWRWSTAPRRVAWGRWRSSTGT